jgi:hypothetical protein
VYIDINCTDIASAIEDNSGRIVVSDTHCIPVSDSKAESIVWHRLWLFKQTNVTIYVERLYLIYK